MVEPTLLQRKLWTVFIFLVKFSLLAIPLHFILWINLDTTLIQQITASNTYYILKLFGQDVTLHGIFIYTDNIIFEFVRDCTAWKPMLAFTALIFSTPLVRTKNRFHALSWAIPLIYIINILRTSSTIYVGIVNPMYLEVVHTFLWREGMMFLIFGMWLYWFTRNKDTDLSDYDLLEKIIASINNGKN